MDMALLAIEMTWRGSDFILPIMSFVLILKSTQHFSQGFHSTLRYKKRMTQIVTGVISVHGPHASL